MPSILISEALIVNEGRSFPGDLFIRNGRIEAIGPDLSAKRADIHIHAKGRALLPGMIDDQVHFREPGLTHKADIASESAAAVAGGITSYMEMPNTKPPTLTRALMEEKYASAQGRSHANYAFYLGAANDNLEEIVRLDPKSTCGVKVFMGSSTGNMLVDDPKILEAIFARSPVPVATHCEDSPMIAENEARFRKKYGREVPMEMHGLIRSREACFNSSALAVDLAKKHGTRLHVLHLSTREEVALFEDLPTHRKKITAEVCVHHLHFAQEDYASKGALIKCNPAIKTAQDRAALIEAVRSGRIDVVATDHAPHTLAEKNASYFEAPSGLPLVEYALPALLEHYHDGRMDLPLIAEKTAHAPARIFNIAERGYIREGYWADLVLVDLEKGALVERSKIISKCGWSPFEGICFRSSIAVTIVSGHLVYQGGKITADPKGMRLAFQ